MQPTARILALATLGVVATLMPVLSADLGPSKALHPLMQVPTSIDLIIRNQKVATLTNTEALMSLIRNGRRVPAHKCTAPGKLALHFGNGSPVEMSILPGHTQTNYEVICARGYLAVPRSAFLSILASAGVETNRIPLK